MLNVPAAAGVPLSVPVPLPLSWNATPLGKVPLSVMLGVGDPVVVTLNEPATPTWNVVRSPLVIAGPQSPVNLVFRLVLGLTPFCAVNVMLNVPAAAGVPLTLPV